MPVSSTRRFRWVVGIGPSRRLCGDAPAFPAVMRANGLRRLALAQISATCPPIEVQCIAFPMSDATRCARRRNVSSSAKRDTAPANSVGSRESTRRPAPPASWSTAYRYGVETTGHPPASANVSAPETICSSFTYGVTKISVAASSSPMSSMARNPSTKRTRLSTPSPAARPISRSR